MKALLLFLLMLLRAFTFSQKSNYSIGGSVLFSYNKIMGGVELNKLYNNKSHETISSLTFKVNYGFLGIKKYELDGIKVKGNSFSIQSSMEPPSGKLLPKDGNYIGDYYNSLEQVVLKGIDFSLLKQFPISNSFFFGFGLGYNNVINNGKVIWYNPIIDDKVERDTRFNFQTVYSISNFGYSFSLNKKLILKTIIQAYFFIPIENGKPSSRYSYSMPNIGVEGDISISLNYKL